MGKIRFFLFSAFGWKEEWPARKAVKKLDYSRKKSPAHVGKKAQFAKNTAAIRLLKKIEGQGRAATAQEQDVLAGYAGWGGLPEAFDVQCWPKENAELKSLLDENEYACARATVTDAFFTPPEIAAAIWQKLQSAGFRSGNLLEPAMGTGNFFGVMDSSVRRYGVEIDPVSGRIAEQLFQTADISICGIEKSRFEDNFFDAVAGNIPFGDYRVYDPRYDRYKLKIHDYFILKCVDLVRPGGLVAVITSRGTLDKKDASFRRLLCSKAGFLGAVRLPSSAFSAYAGTEVTSDILFLQKRMQVSCEEEPWVESLDSGDGYYVNRYFVEHPEMVLGELVPDPRFGNTAACISKDFRYSQLAGALSRIPVTYRDQAGKNEAEPAPPDVKNFTYFISGGEVYFKENSSARKVTLNQKEKSRVMGLDRIRQTLRELLAAQSGADPQMEKLRRELNKRYDRYIRAYGRITSQGNKRAFREDADYPLLCALEVVDHEKDTVEKADIFTKCTVKPASPVTHTGSVREALDVCMDQCGHIDVSRMAAMVRETDEGIAASKKRVEQELPGLAYKDPADGLWKPENEYLSGNVRKKLSAAREAAENDPAFLANVEALERVQPEDIETGDIAVQAGTPWISTEDYTLFLYDLLDVPDFVRRYGTTRVVRNTFDQRYFIENKNMFHSVKATQVYGTGRADAYKLFEQLLNFKQAAVYDRDDEDKRVLNKKETLLARERQDLIREKFREWIFSDAERRRKYVRYYNDTFNATRLREYDGSFLSFPGMSPDVTLMPHQKNAVARVILGGNTLIAHCVGAGKSFEMAAAAMECRRLGLANKPMVVVPKPLVMQMASEFLRLYPGAHVLVATEYDFSKARRQQFTARIAMSDFDCVVMSHSQFGKIPLTPERRKRHIMDQVAELEAAIAAERSAGGEHWTTKQMEGMKKRLAAKLENGLSYERKDGMVYFEDLGVDLLMVDEAHAFKNCTLVTKMNNVAGVNTEGAQKSEDMLSKCRYIEETGGRVVFSTGTPVSNTMCEMYVIQQYLQPGALAEKGLNCFDAWAAVFGEVTTSLELTVDGGGYRAKSRFARFKNLPELMTMFREVADVKNDIPMDTPALRGGKYIISVSGMDQFTKDYMADMAGRADRIHNGQVDAKEDNFLKLTNEARLLGTDARLIDPYAPENPDGKLMKVVNNVIYEYRRAESLGITGTQLVFSDIGTPGTGKMFTVYGFLKDKLVQAGIPEGEVAFIHDCASDAQRQELFRKVRGGEVKVLVGSTEKCGMGVNVQDHAVALHHVDCPWKPAYIEQREGRVLRQGNQNKEVAIYRYVTKGTFDAYSWSLVEGKQKFISQAMAYGAPGRACADLDETVLSYSEVKAVATGNPLIREKMELDNEVQRLKTLRAAHINKNCRLEDDIQFTYPRKIRANRETLLKLQEDAALYERCHTEEFSMAVGDAVFNSRPEAGEALQEAVKAIKPGYAQEAGELYGFKVKIQMHPYSGRIDAVLCGSLERCVEILRSGTGSIRKLENSLKKLREEADACRDRICTLERSLREAKEEAGKPFPYEKELAEKSARLARLNEQLDLDMAA
ncbi:MAG: N-6 DNA methylase [Clostridiales bacterium]|nr:N-6 DNA methylase [Clostridiales bacterium]